MTQTNTKLPREAFKTNRAYEEYQSFLKMIEKKGNMNTPCNECNTLGNNYRRNWKVSRKSRG